MDVSFTSYHCITKYYISSSNANFQITDSDSLNYVFLYLNQADTQFPVNNTNKEPLHDLDIDLALIIIKSKLKLPYENNNPC